MLKTWLRLLMNYPTPFRKCLLKWLIAAKNRSKQQRSKKKAVSRKPNLNVIRRKRLLNMKRHWKLSGRRVMDRDGVSWEELNTQLHAIKAETGELRETLNNILDQIQMLSQKVESVSVEPASPAPPIEAVSQTSDNQPQAQVHESNAFSGVAPKPSLKTFLVSACAVVGVLSVFTIYTFTALVKVQRVQNTSGTALQSTIGALNKQLTSTEAQLSKALEKTVQQEQARAAAMEKAAENGHPTGEEAGGYVPPVTERLNRLRSGHSEKKLIRKETGDWFVFDGKMATATVIDVEIIKALNDAYIKYGRSLTTKIPLPPHNAVCLLKPDGKGGTKIVMTGNFAP